VPRLLRQRLPRKRRRPPPRKPVPRRPRRLQSHPRPERPLRP